MPAEERAKRGVDVEHADVAELEAIHDVGPVHGDLPAEHQPRVRRVLGDGRHLQLRRLRLAWQPRVHVVHGPVPWPQEPPPRHLAAAAARHPRGRRGRHRGQRRGRRGRRHSRGGGELRRHRHGHRRLEVRGRRVPEQLHEPGARRVGSSGGGGGVRVPGEGEVGVVGVGREVRPPVERRGGRRVRVGPATGRHRRRDDDAVVGGGGGGAREDAGGGGVVVRVWGGGGGGGGMLLEEAVELEGLVGGGVRVPRGRRHGRGGEGRLRRDLGSGAAWPRGRGEERGERRRRRRRRRDGAREGEGAPCPQSPVTGTTVSHGFASEVPRFVPEAQAC